MLDFIYDSLDTVKKLKFPTLKQVAQLTAAIFVLVVIAGAYFILADTVFSGGYKVFYGAMTDGHSELSSSIETETPSEEAVVSAGEEESPLVSEETPSLENELTETAE